MAAVEAPEMGDALLGLQPGDIEVEVQAIDALELEGDVILEDLSDGSWYGHGGFRGWTSDPIEGPPAACGQDQMGFRIHPRLHRRSPLPALDLGSAFSSNEAAPQTDEAGINRSCTQRSMPRRSEAQPR